MEAKYVTANGLEFAYLEAGEGPLVVLLHGFPDSARTWEAQMVALAEAGYRVVAPFLRGYPPTQIPADGRYDVRTLGRDLVELVDVLGEGEPAHVVGHDFGSMMVYAAAAESPGSFRRAAIIAVPHPTTFARIALTPKLVHHSYHLWFLATPGIGLAGAANDDMALVDYIWDYWTPAHTDNRAHVARVRGETLSAPGALEAAVAYYRQLIGTVEQPGIPPELMEPTEVPMLAIYGADDPIPGEIAHDEAQHYPRGYRRADVAGARHFTHRDAPEEVNRLLLDWLGGSPDVLVEEVAQVRD